MRNIKMFLKFERYKIILALFFAFPSFAQQTTDAKKIDSLLQLVKVCKVDTTKVELYFTVAKLQSKIDLKKVKFYENKILELSAKNNLRKGIAHHYYLVANDNFLEGNNTTAIKLANKAASMYNLSRKLYFVLNLTSVFG